MNSFELFEKSLPLVPGGVHSPVRSFKGLNRTPLFVEKAEGAFITDAEGKDYIDFCMSFGPLILGHTDSEVKQELTQALGRGWSYGACERYSLELVEFLKEKLPFIDQMRFVNSGTEAVMTALRLARGATGRNKIIKFNGCYHGHVDSMLIKAGSGLAGTAEASSKGIPKGIAEDTLIAELNNEKALEQIFNEHGNDIAAIIVEPLPANNGLLPQKLSYLKFLREITKKNGSLLIFDEVISGFRMGFGGVAKSTNLAPDLVTYGKIIGGGLPVGAIAGKKEIMSHLAPVGGVYQAGTLSANPLAMVGGLSSLKKLSRLGHRELNKRTLKIVRSFQRYLDENQERFGEHTVIQRGSLFWLSPGKKTLRSLDELPSNFAEKFAELYDELLQKGIYIAPNAYEVGFVSHAHDDKVIEELDRRLWT